MVRGREEKGRVKGGRLTSKGRQATRRKVKMESLPMVAISYSLLVTTISRSIDELFATSY